MADGNNLFAVNELPGDATNAEAIAWVAKIRRLLDRWETLPGYERRSMTPELKQLARAQLDDVEQSVRRNMEAANS